MDDKAMKRKVRAIMYEKELERFGFDRKTPRAVDGQALNRMAEKVVRKNNG